MTRSDSSQPILVTGATGRQGGATARALLAQGTPVRALVRDSSAAAALDLKSLGASLVKGDLNDPASLRAACEGVRGVFSVQTPDMRDMESDIERVHGKNLVEAARAMQVPQFVHTSVSGKIHPDKPGWDNHWNANYYISKAYTEQLVREAGFAYWTLLKPAFFMENFARPSFMFANFVEDRLLTILQPETALSLIAVGDIGTAAAAAFENPDRFNHQELELAGDRLTMKEIAAILSERLGKPLVAPSLSPPEALEQGLHPALIQGQDMLNKVGSPARPEQAREKGLSLTDFKTWAAANWR